MSNTGDREAGVPEPRWDENTPVVPVRPDVIPTSEAEAGERIRRALESPTEAGSTRVDFGGRRNAELRIAGTLGLMWWATTVHALVWTFVLLDDREFAQLPWLWLGMPHVVGLTALMITMFAQLPRARWARFGSLVNYPSSLPLVTAGFPTAPIVALFVWRDRAARNERSEPEDVEYAFRQLLASPRILGGSLLAWLGGALLVDALLMAGHLAWETQTTAAVMALFASLVTPMAAICVSRIRAMLRPELISAPRARPTTLGPQRDVRSSLAIPSFLTLFGITLAPVLGVWLWQARTDEARALQEAEVAVHRLVRQANEDPSAIREGLASVPGGGVELEGQWFGTPHPDLERRAGAIDHDGDGQTDLVTASYGRAFAVMPLRAPHVLPSGLVIMSVLFGLVSGFGALMLVVYDTGRDITRATDQVRDVADGKPATAVSEGAFFALELRQLVQSVDRLVNRITETNIAKYVAIEKAKEADRLKSQFLANMSHDLRSPLNSILGFSELLLTGIEGELGDEQRRMVNTIYDSGRELLQQIDDILDTAKIEAGRMEIHPEPTPPANLVTRAIQSARKRLPPEIDITTEVSAGLPPAFVDPYRTVQAIENVLVFAAERVEEGTLRVAVRQRMGRNGQMVAITVETPVRPASAPELTAVLRGFFRIPGHKGLGLSLPIAGAILELQTGSLDILDAGTGAAFELHLPAPESRRPVRYRETRR